MVPTLQALLIPRLLLDMNEYPESSTAKITPRPQIRYCSQGRAVLATDLEGLINDSPRQGFFYGETRLLSLYRYLVEGRRPEMIAVSNVEQHSWLGYYISPPTGSDWKKDTGSGHMEEVSEQTIELKISRTVGLGVHEDIDFTNYSQTPGRTFSSKLSWTLISPIRQKPSNANSAESFAVHGAPSLTQAENWSFTTAMSIAIPTRVIAVRRGSAADSSFVWRKRIPKSPTAI